MKRVIVLFAVFLVVFAAVLPSPASADNWHRGHRGHVGWWWPGALVGGLVSARSRWRRRRSGRWAPWRQVWCRRPCRMRLRRPTPLHRLTTRRRPCIRRPHTPLRLRIRRRPRTPRRPRIQRRGSPQATSHPRATCRRLSPSARSRIRRAVRAPWRWSAPAMAVGLGVGVLGATGGIDANRRGAAVALALRPDPGGLDAIAPALEAPVPRELGLKARIGRVPAARIGDDEDRSVPDPFSLGAGARARRRPEELSIRGATHERHRGRPHLGDHSR